MMNKFYTPEHIFDAEFHKIIRRRFISSTTGEFFTDKKTIILVGNQSLLSVADCAASLVNGTITSDSERYLIVTSPEAFICILQGSGEEIDFPWRRERPVSMSEITVMVTASRQIIKEVMNSLNVFDISSSVIGWWRATAYSPVKNNTVLEEPTTKLLPEFYPGLTSPGTNKKVTPQEYLSDYLNSVQAILILVGLPGTGKTSLLRHFFYDFKLNVDIVYDNALFERDEIYQDFMKNNSTVLLLEDADELLETRKERTSPVARILNSADGLIKPTISKKIIFTTNLPNLDNVDSALIRPGRCYDILRLPDLDFEEAKRAARAAGVPEPTRARSYSLSEIFNHQAEEEAPQKKIGFI